MPPHDTAHPGDRLSEEVAKREIAHEQAFVDRVYRQLEKSAANAKERAARGTSVAVALDEGGLVERDAMVFQAARRIAQLDAVHEGLVFGRLDLDPAFDHEARYIGRIGLRDDARDSLLIDWRAPAAAVFYQATAAEPQRVVRRRVLRCVGSSVTGIEDELLDPTIDADLPIVGEGALMAQLSRARDRSMHSIVATIQAEQDRAIRAPSRGATLITGGPGTGKTVVALHRAAYLLYTDRRRYESGGVLIVGPSGVFMRYIERVLPSLGETAVALERSLGEVVDGLRAGRHDEPRIADVKGAARMAEPMRRAARQAVPGGPSEFRVFWRDEVIVLEIAACSPRIRRTMLSHGQRNRQLPRVAATLLDAMWRQVRGERGRERGREAFDDEMLSHQEFVDFAVAWLGRCSTRRVYSRGWPIQSSSAGWAMASSRPRTSDCFSSRGRCSRTRRSKPEHSLLDELRYALGDIPQRTEEEHTLDDAISMAEGSVDLQELTTASDREYAPSGRPWSPPTHRIEDDPFAHVLIDEAQDLTPMQWRMVGRRGRNASWTIVGDPAQSSWPAPEESAAARAEALDGKQIHDFHLSTNYRNSSEIYAHAAAYASRVGLDADLPAAVRATGDVPRVLTDVEDLEAAVRAEVGRTSGSVPGTIGVVVPVARRSEVNAWLASWPEFAADAPGAARSVDSSVPPSGEDRIVVLTGLDTKGLEFDGIVVVRPQEIEDESATGRSTLYVVFTRATQRLTIIN